jgi:hypothetical protein
MKFFRQYQIGWTDEAGREPMLEFRLTIDNAQEGDTGAYTCTTPSKHSHRVDIVVKSERASAVVKIILILILF